MSVNEVLQAVGAWSVGLSTDTPRDVLDSLDYFGHVVVLGERLDPRQYGDALLSSARYVGVLRERSIDATGNSISGCGMTFWLGDEDDKGAVIESAITVTSETFPNAIRAVLPTSVHEGVLHSVPGAITQRWQWQTPRKAIEYICSSFGNGGLGASAVEYRVNGNGSLDAGYVSDLYVTNPTCIIATKDRAGYDLELTGLPGSFGVKRDVDDFTTRVVLIGEGSGISVVTGSADVVSNPYLDLFGQPVKLTRVISESDTPASSAASRAALQLAQYAGTNDDLTLQLDDYDVEGSFKTGDMVYVWDPDSALVDTAVEKTFRGQRINPIALRVTEMTWPVTEGMTVAYRAKDGTWTDLTDYLAAETGTTSVKVGAFSRTLTGSSFEPVGSRPAVDTSIPAAPALISPFEGAVYLDARGFTRAKMIVHWSAPLNTDGSTILDGDHYEIRYAVDTDAIYPAKWAAVEEIRWDDMQVWGQPFAFPDGAWQIVIAPWGDTSMLLQDLSPGIGYDVQIRAVDTSGNASDWSGTTTAITNPDNIPPSTPAAPEVAASRIAIQVIHELGQATGGTYNLEADLDHFDVHVSSEPTFLPDDTTSVGKLRATGGMVAAGIPAVGTFQVEETTERWVKVVAVDIAGNASNASDAASATVLLIDDAHISDLTVSKVTAGTINADWIVAASIKTAPTGARVELSNAGLLAYNNAGTQTVDISSADGSVSVIGQLASGPAGKRVVVSPLGSTVPEIRFYPSTGSNYSGIYAQDKADEPTETELYLLASENAEGTARTWVHVRSGIFKAAVYNPDLSQIIGGDLEVSEDLTKIGWDDQTANANYLVFNNSGYMFGVGEIDTGDLYTSQAMFICGRADYPDPGTGVTVLPSIGYATTQTSTPKVLAMLYDQDGDMQGVDNLSTTGFSMRASGISTAYAFTWWVFRGGSNLS